MGFHLDTSVAIRLRDGDLAVVERIAGLPLLPSLSIVTRVELDGGIYAQPHLATKRLQAVDAMLARLQVIDFDRAAADAYRGIVAALGFSRSQVADRMIAATALVHGATLITGNAKDFRTIPRLQFEIW